MGVERDGFWLGMWADVLIVVRHVLYTCIV